MGNKGVTEKQVHAAAATLVERGDAPTIQAIRQILGTGSLTTISKYLETWRRQPTSAAGLTSVQDADAKELLHLLKLDHPQVIAVVLSHLTPERSAAVIARLAPKLREDVIVRIEALEHVAPAILAALDGALRAQLKQMREEAARTGGPKYAAALRAQLGGDK